MITPKLFTPLTIRGTTTRNRVVISPMCQYSANKGRATNWHLVHLGRYALGGAGIVFVEATAVEARGRISHLDLGLYEETHVESLMPVAHFLKENGAVPAIQLSHAGRKASGHAAWQGAGPLSAEDQSFSQAPWQAVAPSAVAAEGWPPPVALSIQDISELIDSWRSAALRARAAGFDIIEIHGGHGYLIHEFLSPVSNFRKDRYGGSMQNRMRFALEIVEAVRSVWPDDKPLFFRVSALDGSGGGWTLDDTVTLSRLLHQSGVDLIDCSSGGMTGPTPTMAIPREYGFQVPFSETVRREVGILTCAVGLIIEPNLAESIVKEGKADLVAIGREALNDPNWALHARNKLQAGEFGDWPLPFRGWLERRAATIELLERGLSENK